MSESIESSEWLSVADAAARAECPLRSVYNWVNSKSISSRKQDGVTLVCLQEVLEKTRQRALVRAEETSLPAALPPAQVTAARASTIAMVPAGETSSLPPELLAHIIGRFRQGADLTDIVLELKLPTALALEAQRQYELLVAASGQPTLRQQMDDLMHGVIGRLDEFEARLRGVEEERAVLGQQILKQLQGLVAESQDVRDRHLAMLANHWAEMLKITDRSLNSLHERHRDLAALVYERLR